MLRWITLTQPQKQNIDAFFPTELVQLVQSFKGNHEAKRSSTRAVQEKHYTENADWRLSSGKCRAREASPTETRNELHGPRAVARKGGNVPTGVFIVSPLRLA